MSSRSVNQFGNVAPFAAGPRNNPGAPQGNSPRTSPRAERETDEEGGIKRSRAEPTTHSEPAFKKARSELVVPVFDAVYRAFPFRETYLPEKANKEDALANWQALLAQLDPQTLRRRFADQAAQWWPAAIDSVAIACLLGYTDLVQEFAGQGVNLHVHCGQLQMSLLEIAVEGGHLPMVDFLLAKGLGRDDSGSSKHAFLRACEKGDWPIVEHLIEACAGLNLNSALFHCLRDGEEKLAWRLLGLGGLTLTQGSFSDSAAFCYACGHGFLELAQEMTRRGIDPLDERFPSSAPGSAAEAGQVKVLEWLLDLAGESDARTSLIQSAFARICEKGKREVVSQPGRDTLGLLLSLGADPYLGDALGMTPLMHAARNPGIDVDRMLHGGEKLNATDGHGNSALRYAVAAQREDVVDKLLDCGAAPDSSALIQAAKLESSSLLKRLHAAGGDLNCRNKNGKTLLIVAAPARATEVLRYLLAQNQAVGQKDDWGSKALHYACRAGKLDAVKLLITAGANAGELNEEGDPPLILAATNPDSDVPAWLLEQGLARVDDRGVEDRTILHVIAKTGSVDMLRQILKYRPNPNARDAEGRTPIFVAAARNHIEVLKLLQGNGASLNSTNSEGNALDVAIKWHASDAVAWLLGRGLRPTVMPAASSLSDWMKDLFKVHAVGDSAHAAPVTFTLDQISRFEHLDDPFNLTYLAHTSGLLSNTARWLSSRYRTASMVGIQQCIGSNGRASILQSQYITAYLIANGLPPDDSPEPRYSSELQRAEQREREAIAKLGKAKLAQSRQALADNLPKTVISHINLAGVLRAPALKVALESQFGLLPAVSQTLLVLVWQTRLQLGLSVRTRPSAGTLTQAAKAHGKLYRQRFEESLRNAIQAWNEEQAKAKTQVPLLAGGQMEDSVDILLEQWGDVCHALGVPVPRQNYFGPFAPVLPPTFFSAQLQHAPAALAFQAENPFTF